MSPPVDAVIVAPPGTGSATSEPIDMDVPDAMPHSLHRAVYARHSEYVRPHRVRVKVGTWNVAACPGTDHDLAAWFVDGKGVDCQLSNVFGTSSNGALEPEVSILDPTAVEEELESGGQGPAAVRVIGNDKVGLYVLGLQEVVDLNMASQYVSRVYADTPTPVLERWKTALSRALPAGYVSVATEQMSGLLLLVYASPETACMISHASTSAVGTGLLGMLGNKGAVSANVVLGESTRMVFVNSHLASGNDASHIDRRCWDVSHIESRTQFTPYYQPGVSETRESEKISDADFAFWFGDLNFRLDLPGDDIRRILTLHARGEYDLTKPQRQDDNGSANVGGGNSLAGEEAVVLKKPGATDKRDSWASGASEASRPSTESTATTMMTDDDDEDAKDKMSSHPTIPDTDDFVPDSSQDPASLQATLDSLLPHDQLSRAIKDKKVFHDGWREGRITFLPSYKYDVGTVGLFDSSEKHRAPSWCDRILYRTRKDKDDYERMVKDKEEAKKRDGEMTKRGLDHAGDEEEVLFEYQPDTDGGRRPSAASSFDYDEYDGGEYNADEDLEEVPQTSDTTDRINLDVYTSHQRIQSSDHKPVVSIFTIDFDAVVPELKAAVYAEVAKELDRTENESRPSVTIVVDSRVVLHPVKMAAIPDADEAVTFGPLTFLQKSTATLTIANTGRVPAVFSFVEKPTIEDVSASGSVAHPYQWLTTSFERQDKNLDDVEQPFGLHKEMTLEPGETVNAILEASVEDLLFARMLNDAASKLEDVLVLRVKNGRDHFIPVRGTWAPTCIGRSVEELVRVPDGGIRSFVATLTEEAAKKSGKKALNNQLGSISYDLDVRCSAPKELFKLTETIENLVDRVIADEQMLEEHLIPSDRAGWPFENPTRPPERRHIVAIINALDNDQPLLDAFEPELPSLLRLEVASHVLLIFLRGLTDGVVTISLWARLDQATLPSLNSSPRNANPIARDPNAEADKNAILDILASTPHHNISFVFLTTTLSRIIAELAPLSLGDVDALRSIGRNSSSGSGSGISAAIGGIGSIGRRSLRPFKKSGDSPDSAALEALDRRIAREKRYAEIFGSVVCRAPLLAKERERKAQEDKQRAILELFLRRSREELGG
ncbi:hypothetical protein SEPCBS57363_001750 [Sporothrix epigloea]|uniref:Inositol polyphosphate-related phosphatase domain-containing protein n=1 Tax=Sporothrix epigloea TaxID=1892477 RepID=A0ABP0DC97_9PEZI